MEKLKFFIEKDQKLNLQTTQIQS